LQKKWDDFRVKERQGRPVFSGSGKKREKNLIRPKEKRSPPKTQQKKKKKKKTKTKKPWSTRKRGLTLVRWGGDEEGMQ